nr:hypothetical protein [Bacillus pumilus]
MQKYLSIKGMFYVECIKRGTTWQYRIKHMDPVTQEVTELSKGEFSTKRSASCFASKHKELLRSDIEVGGVEITLKQFL